LYNHDQLGQIRILVQAKRNSETAFNVTKYDKHINILTKSFIFQTRLTKSMSLMRKRSPDQPTQSNGNKDIHPVMPVQAQAIRIQSMLSITYPEQRHKAML